MAGAQRSRPPGRGAYDPPMLIPSAMFANSAGGENGLLDIQGGGWEWVNLRSFPGTVHGVVAGLVELDPGHQPTPIEASATGRISYVGALIGEQTRTARAHVVLPNPQESWRPGLFVTVDVMTEASEIALAVHAEALQTVDNKSVVFVRVDDGFKAQEVRTGRSDGKSVEILSGLQAGQQYAASGSFAIKAELGKGAAFTVRLPLTAQNGGAE